ncbi:MAG: hypothetical protein SGILL_001169 [Bacillariaceae sp.]
MAEGKQLQQEMSGDRRDQDDHGNNAEDEVAGSASALKELVLTPREASMTSNKDSQDASARIKRSRSQFETPSPRGPSPGKASRSSRSLLSPPQLKRSTRPQSPRGPNIFEIMDCFPTLDGVGQRPQEAHGQDDLSFATRLKMKSVPTDHHQDLSLHLP